MEKFLVFLANIEMEIPTTWGWFHIMWFLISAAVVAIFIYYKQNNKQINEKLVFGIYGYGSLILEIIKQLMWSVTLKDGQYVWSYNWYAAPYQLCTTPMFVAIALTFVKKEKAKECLMSYLGLFTIISSFAVMLMPDSCFVEDVLVDIHTMYLHFGAFVMALYVHIFNKVKINYEGLLKGFIVFVGFVISALLLNVVVFKSGLCGENTFNMFYISPYFPSSLPVFSDVWQIATYPIFLALYIFAFMIGSTMVMFVIKFVKYMLMKLAR